MECRTILYRDAGLEVEITVRGIRSAAVSDQLVGPARDLFERLLCRPGAAVAAEVPRVAVAAVQPDPPASAGPAVATPSPTASPQAAAAASRPTAAQRHSVDHVAVLLRARTAGEQARSKMDGLIRTVAATPPHASVAKSR